MSEDFEEKPAEPLDMSRYVDLARRRYPYFLVAFFTGWLLVWGASWVLPVSYKSGTLILVEQPTMPKDYVVSNINEDLQERVQSITQQILSRTRLLQIIDKFHLYSSGHAQLTPDDKVARMRKDIELGIVHDATNLKITAFRVDYSAADPHIAQQVTGELANLFINENLEVRQKESEDTTKFLQSQLEAARENLNVQDAKIRAFKGEHVGDLPTQQAANLQILAGMQAQLQNEQDGINAARQQQAYLQTLINQYRSLQSSPRTADGTALPAIDKELETLRSQLADLSARYTDSYPDVLKVKSQIARAEKTRAGLIADMKLHANDSKQAEAVVPAHEMGDPTQGSPLLQLEGQLQANRLEIENRERTIGALKGKVGEYQGRLNEGPVREQQLADLTRGYDQSKANYDQLLKKESDSRMATSMEQLQKGQRFRMIDPPSLPLKPDFPNRLKFCGMGIGLGLALGLLLAGGLEFLDDRMHSDRTIKALLPMKVISEIPEIVTETDEARSKRNVRLQWAASVLVVLVILAGSAFSYLRS
jgi:polysaccharide biosynthesis transport protein